MNKKELVNVISERLGFTKKDVTAVVDTVVDAITTALANGTDVSIAGFGKFISTEVAERTGTIQMGDRKGETYTTPAHRAPKFKAAKTLKDALL